MNYKCIKWIIFFLFCISSLTYSQLSFVNRDFNVATKFERKTGETKLTKYRKNVSEQRRGSSIEIAHGQAFVDWTDSWLYVTSFNYIYQFNNTVSLGGGVGFEVYWKGLLPKCSINSVWGNKVDGFAFSLDLNLHPSTFDDVPVWPTLGSYYRNFFLKVTPSFITHEEEFYAEIGYSMYLGN